MLNYEAYWDAQFSKYHYIWGQTPSRSAEIALALFRQQRIHKVLIPGSGYGRNSKLFSTSGFEVTGIEISEQACALAREYDPATKVHQGSFLEAELDQGAYEGIYCFNVLQLFPRTERIAFIRKSTKVLAAHGFMFFTGISDTDASYGQGQEVENNTFAVAPEKILHFFSLEDLKEHFEEFKILETGSFEDQVTHTLYGLKSYQIRYIFVCR